jgi:membrane fusion protein, multidrug efflux system
MIRMSQPTSNLPFGARWIPALTAAVLISGVPFGGCTRESSPGSAARKGGAPVPVLVAPAVEKSVPVQIRAIGNVMPYSQVTIRSQITGQLRDVCFKEGQEVKKGDPLYTIDPRPAQAALDQVKADLARAQAQAENAKVVFDRTQALFESKIASQEAYDNARAALHVAEATALSQRAALTNAMLNLEFTRITSPVDGVAGAQLVYAGNIIKAEDDAMLTINQIHPINVSFAVPEQYLAEIQRERRRQPLRVLVTSGGRKGSAPAGELTFLNNTVDTTTGLIQLKGTFANADGALWPGQFVQVELNLAELPHAVVVPSQAIQTGQKGEYVFVVLPDETVELRTVQAGQSSRGETVVSSGLRAGETVVTDGQLNLVSGRKVDVKPTPGNGGSAGASPDSP